MAEIVRTGQTSPKLEVIRCRRLFA